jgi:hypothetical protein
MSDPGIRVVIVPEAPAEQTLRLTREQYAELKHITSDTTTLSPLPPVRCFTCGHETRDHGHDVCWVSGCDCSGL